MSEDGAGPLIQVLSPPALVDLAGAPVNPVLTIVATRPDEGTGLCYHVADGRHGRTDATLDIIEDLRRLALRERMTLTAAERIVIQAEDVPVEADGVSWEARSGWSRIRLIPDLYYFQAKGHEDFEPSLAPWDQRDDRVVWRGSTTGRFWQCVEELDELPRYRLCRAAGRLGPRADFGVTDVVQAADPAHEALIRDRLRREGYLREFMPFVDMGRYRYVLDIDGNANSWNFMMKLRLGCCVLRVESPWRQWFSDRLMAWTHYVPVREDLSDLAEKVDWCFSHPEMAAAIADRGKTFALEMRFEQERTDAARTVFASRGSGRTT